MAKATTCNLTSVAARRSLSPSALATHRVVWAEAIPHDGAAPPGLEALTLCRQASPPGLVWLEAGF
ncbi:MAG: hypothetical protein WHS83_18815 [Chloroflexus sp.]|uniref:hypothetical protein n=1 Tax=Chloroflexus sp. TaxID=1904827 RepID=UPI00309BD07E